MTADAYRTAIAGLNEDVFQGKLADATKDEFGKIASRHEAEEQYAQKLSELIGQCGIQILVCKNEINSTCARATAKIFPLEAKKAAATKPADQQSIQKKIDEAKKQARDNIADVHNQLEDHLAKAAASMKILHDEIETSSKSVEGKGQQPAARDAHATPVEPAVRESHADVPGAGPAGAGGGGAPGARGLSNGAPVNPAAMLGAMPQQMPQMPQMPGGGMGSHLPGQELASKAMDMAHDMGGKGGKDSTYLSDSSVKDLLAASGDHGGAGHGGGDGHGGQNGSGGGQSAAGNAGGGGVPMSVANPTVASGPSPAAPVSSRPTGGPAVAMTELAGTSTSGPVSGLSSAAAGVSGLTGAPATQVAAAAGALNAAAVNAAAGSPGNAEAGAPVGFTPTAGSVGVPSTVGGLGAPVPGSAAQTPVAAHVPATPSSPVVPTTPPPTPPAVPPPVTPPPTVAGFNPVPASMGSTPAGLLDMFGPPTTVAVMAAAPQLETLPVEQRITILNTASIVTQMREKGWVASVATALINDGSTVAVVIATGDDLSILPPDTTIPKASILLHRFHLGERFRSEWAGCADTVSKLIAAVDAHPWLDRSMIKHVSAFTRNREIGEPSVPFTPISMDAAWAIRFLYTPPRETAPAYTLQGETFTEAQISYLLGAAERKWQLPTIRLSRKGQARLESASMFASRWSKSGEAQQKSSPRGYDSRIAGYLWAATREAFLDGDLERASWYGQYLRYQTLPASKLMAA
ncbi:hypothetical protein [Mycobacterium intracellulare]|uniref:hypothetical protein n=1 Tax=Mycobacterium intracellulare TaxID=1767 RepID=UPI001EED5897|nr:hypothetical protein [Mycobacterium intracellulare]MEE3755318.1 hypothetical protein [Mycobacterium intracellulare]